MKSLTEKLSALRKGDLLATANIEECLQTVTAKNPELNALVYLNSNEARERAKVLDSLPISQRGAVHGLAFSVKDNFPVVGLPCSEGSTQTLYICCLTTPCWTQQHLIGAVERYLHLISV